MSDVAPFRALSVDTTDEELGKDLQELGEKLLKMSRELLRGQAADETEQPVAEAASADFNDQIIGGIALSIYRARQRRSRYFTSELFGEPVWDVLLELFINKTQETRVSSTSLCLAAGVPVSTASRTIRRLEREGLLRRYSAPDDRRVVLVELTATGYKLMRTYISDGVLREEMPLPDELARR